ncbi:conserved protein of unknown function [Magnetospirillum gryphiswaldense MSR-1 v2]|uniref:Uncharacterized protein n=1 Tax=Magnetospirillum gryphiswaldense (strain DSM 6361 / JCM 21280 / NBRC 15271 / MSR-1) TaxID=431944 RepID=V6F8R0_MAGGM|nr:hypothetical protein [Magnetospirillum gryphiswaldense]CDL01173.1 conserved protein of unknown function [Magnetospirillum gryphiswaldense MSR-1 v2]
MDGISVVTLGIVGMLGLASLLAPCVGAVVSSLGKWRCCPILPATPVWFCSLLVLGKHDFHSLLDSHDELRKIISEIAQKRLVKGN